MGDLDILCSCLHVAAVHDNEGCSECSCRALESQNINHRTEKAK